MTARSSKNLAVYLIGAAVVWCVSVAAWVWWSTSPRGLHRPFPQLGLLFSIPIVILIAAGWAAWSRRNRLFLAFSGLFVVFFIVTGFAFGDAFLPVIALLILAAIANLERP